MGHELAPDDNASAVVDTARPGHRLVLNGWFASRADAGTPGPHVAVGSRDRQPVLHVDQVPDLVAALQEVAARIGRQWEREGEAFVRAVAADSGWADPDAPEEQEQRRRRDEEWRALLVAHLPLVLEVIAGHTDRPAAAADLAARLGRPEDDLDLLLALDRFTPWALLGTDGHC